MYVNLKPNQHKRISFNTTTMTSLGFVGPPLNLAPPPPTCIFLLRSPPPKFYFFAQVPPPQLFWSEIFRTPPKIGGGRGGAATMKWVISRRGMKKERGD